MCRSQVSPGATVHEDHHRGHALQVVSSSGVCDKAWTLCARTCIRDAAEAPRALFLCFVPLHTGRALLPHTRACVCLTCTIIELSNSNRAVRTSENCSATASCFSLASCASSFALRTSQLRHATQYDTKWHGFGAGSASPNHARQTVTARMTPPATGKLVWRSR